MITRLYLLFDDDPGRRRRTLASAPSFSDLQDCAQAGTTRTPSDSESASRHSITAAHLPVAPTVTGTSTTRELSLRCGLNRRRILAVACLGLKLGGLRGRTYVEDL
jgi:hypothetical protein